MRITYEAEGVFAAESSYREKEIPKGAGFRWDPKRKRWWTQDWRRARELAGYCDEKAKAAAQRMEHLEARGIEDSRATDSDIEVPAPEGLSYYPFQKAGIAYALERPFVLNADQMGCGKTIQTVGLINAIEHYAHSPTASVTVADLSTVLIICPAAVRINWKREIEKWLLRPVAVTIFEGTRYDEALWWEAMRHSDRLRVVVVNYDVLGTWHPSLALVEWSLLVCDECHRLKNSKAQRTRYVYGYRPRKPKEGEEPEEPIAPIVAKRHLMLTGTPILNRPIELWTLLKAAGWRNWKEFVERYCDGHQTDYGWDVSGYSHLDELQAKLRSTIMVRRLKSEVLKDLPPKLRQVLEVPANGARAVVEREVEAWDRHEEQLERLQAAVEISKASDDPEDYKAAVAALREGTTAAFEETSRIRQEIGLAKVPHVVAHCLEALESEQKLILFGHHHEVIRRYEDGLADAGIMSVAYTGEQTDMALRQAMVDSFQEDPELRVFIGSIRAAGEGITLTAANLVVFGELDWVPGVMSQAEDRSHRIGQHDGVLVQHIVLEGSHDAKMARTLVEKQDVIDRALDEQPEHEDPEWGKFLPVAGGTTRHATRSQLEAEAAALTPEEIAEIHASLRHLAMLCDGATLIDGMGFNKLDSRLGRELASLERLTPRQAALGKRMVHKYRRQLGD